MQGKITIEDSRTAGTVTQRFLKGLGIGGLAALASFGLADRVNATYFELDDARASIYAEHYTAGNYIDRERYYLLDESQYYYLDRGQYNLLGGLGYSFGRPYYQKRADMHATPEPSTIGFLVLGALGVLVLRNKRRTGEVT